MSAKEWLTQKSQELEKDVEFLTYKANLDFTEDMLRILNEKGIKHVNKYLAEKLNCSPAYITKLLKGNPNLTIKKMVEIALILDQDLEIKLIPKTSKEVEKGITKDDVVNVGNKAVESFRKGKSSQRRKKIRL